MNSTILKESNLVFPMYLVPTLMKENLSFQDTLLFLYFWNNNEQIFDVLKISEKIHLSEQEVLMSFNNLLSQKILRLNVIKDSNGKRVEVVDLEPFYVMLGEEVQEEVKNEEQEDIYSIFEAEFGRTISPMEYEIINAWLEKGFTKELILGALREATYNGVSNLRYIDKILYEWQRKGYKTMKEVQSQNVRPQSKENNEVKELFDYDWLDDNEG